jgi:hypothetical protein
MMMTHCTSKPEIQALFVLTKIDEIMAWEQRCETERDTRFVELGRYSAAPAKAFRLITNNLAANKGTMTT